jgi:NodT family efflux transporter outer membrane factor (OMF) lipoprotein
MWHTAHPSDDLKRGDWWLRFHDPTLDKLISRLDLANSDLAIAIAHYDLANAYAVQARAGLYPTVNSAAYTTRNRQSDTRALRSQTQPDVYGDNAIGLISSYELDLWGRVRNVVQAAQAGAQAASADLESIKLSLRAELVSTYLELRVNDVRQQLLANEVDSYTEAVKLTQNRFLGKIDSALNVSRAKAQLDTAKARLSENAADRALFEHAIATLVGEPASSFSLAQATTDLNPPEIPVGIPAALLQRRPDISAAERRLAQANAEIGVARAAFFPDITLAASAGVESTFMPGLISAPNLFWSIGPSALLTIFDAGKRKAVEAQAQAAFDAAGGQYRGTVLRAFQEVEDSLSQLNELAHEAAALKDAVTDTQNALDIAMNLYREGAVSFLEVVTAQTAAQQAQLDELNVRNRRLQATVLLIRALGGGWSKQEEMANAE